MFGPYPLQQSVEASREFDPVGTLVVLVIMILSAYAARAGWRRYRGGAGVRAYGWLVVAAIGGLVAVLTAVSFLVNIGAAFGLV